MHPDDAPPLLNPPQFNLPRYVWFAWFPCAALVAWLNWLERLRPADPGHTAGYVIGAVAGSLLLPMGFSWIAWRLARRQGRGHGIVFLVVLGLVVLGQVNQRLATGRKHATSTAELTRMLDEEKARMRASLDSRGNLDNADATRLLHRATDSLQNVADSSHGDARAQALGGQAFLQRVGVFQQRYARAVERLQIDTFFSLESVATAGVRATRQAALAEFQAACVDLRRFVEHGAEMFEEELRKQGVSGKNLGAAVADYRTTTKPRQAIMLGIREKDEAMAADMAAFIRFGEKYEGRWSTNPATGAVQLPDDEAVATFNGLLERVAKTGQEQVALQQQLLSIK